MYWGWILCLGLRGADVLSVSLFWASRNDQLGSYGNFFVTSLTVKDVLIVHSNEFLIYITIFISASIKLNKNINHFLLWNVSYKMKRKVFLPSTKHAISVVVY